MITPVQDRAWKWWEWESYRKKTKECLYQIHPDWTKKNEKEQMWMACEAECSGEGSIERKKREEH
jgi:hypothetical protein